MQAVGRLGSYISGPFHPFGGAVDIIVVEQPDGSMKSSPWYVRFGKFQGVLRSKEKVINISVNGVEASFNMYLDDRGEAYFLSEVDVEEGESVSYPFSSGDETDGKPEDNRTPLTSKSCNFPANDLKKVDQIDVSNGKILRRTNSRRSRIFGLVFGRRSMKENNHKGENDGRTVGRNDSLERAEFAANLMEVKWSTNLNKNKSWKDNASPFTASHMLDGKAHKDTQTDAVQSQVTSSMPDEWGKKSGKETCSRNDQVGDSSQSGLETYAEETTLDVSCLSPPEELVETSTLDDVLEGKREVMSEVSRYVNESVMRVTEEDANVNRVLSRISDPDSHLVELQACPSRHFDEEQVFSNRDVMSPGCDISQKEVETDRVQTFIYYESLESSMVRKDATSNQTHEMLYVASGKCGEVHVCAETLHARSELLSEDMVTEQLLEVIELEERPVDGPQSYSELTLPFHSCTNNYSVVTEEPTTVPKSCTQMNLVNALPNPVEKFPSQSMHNNSSCSNLGHRVLDGKTMKVENFTINSSSSSGSVDDCVMTDVENVKEEQFLFSDIDESKVMVIQSMESKFPGNMDRETSPFCCQEGIKELNESANQNKESYSCSEIYDQENLSSDFENSVGNTRASSNSLCIPKSHSVSGNEVGPLAKSFPNMRSCTDNCGRYDVHRLSRSLDSNSILSKWTLQSKDDSTSRKSNEDTEPQLAVELLDIKDAPVLGELELEHEHANPAVGDLSKSNVASSGSWRLWSFPFRRSSSRKAMEPALSDAGNSDTDDASESKIGMQGDENILRSKVVKKTVKKMVRAISPTSEQLASLNLKEGRNTVTFTFSTSMLGKQQVDARIFLWKWNTRIVISDVDGTITRSDVLGQFMPLVGVDWSQTGVAHLFSAIKENGYQLLFLSARAISQAYNTRQFLLNLKQDGKALPDGPMVISPDGLFPSLFREVIRKAPHEFKIACLEGIKALFPSDCQPFYAGFGNRDTDEISYLKVGIPRGKIFIINPKGEVAVNRRIDTKSYKSLHALVNGMFPPTVSSEQEDFNSWNYWRLPPPTIDY